MFGLIGDGQHHYPARDAIKLALPGFRRLVEWWGLPTRLAWPYAPDRGALGYQTGSLAARMAFGRLRGPWVQDLKPSSSCGLPSGGLLVC